MQSAVGTLGWRLHDFYGVEGGHFGLYLVADDRRAPGIQDQIPTACSTWRRRGACVWVGLIFLPYQAETVDQVVTFQFGLMRLNLTQP